jgi:ClpP class serine protease
MEQTAKLFDGRVHMAAAAKDLGLVDAVMSFDQAMAELAQLVASKRTGPENARRLQLAKARR